jgi:DNA-binding transcriptional ArsR family regulator
LVFLAFSVDASNLASIGPPAIRVGADRGYGFSPLHKREVVKYGCAMALSHPLPDQVVELLAQRFRVLGDPTRIRLLERLRRSEATVTELTLVTGATQQNVSKHLGILRDAGIVERRKQGTASLYRIADETIFELCEQVCGSLERRLSALGGLLAASRAA